MAGRDRCSGGAFVPDTWLTSRLAGCIPWGGVRRCGIHGCLLLAGVLMTASCGIIGAPIRVAAALTRSSVEAGRKLHRKAEAASERRKQERAGRETAKEQGATAAAEGEVMDGSVLPPLPAETGGEPDLMLNPPPPPEEPTYPALPE